MCLLNSHHMYKQKKVLAVNEQDKWRNISKPFMSTLMSNDAFQLSRFHLAAAALLAVIVYFYVLLCALQHKETFFLLSLPLFPCYCCPDTMVISRRCTQESFCQPACAMCRQILQRQSNAVMQSVYCDSSKCYF